jgi:hypothetical protein
MSWFWSNLSKMTLIPVSAELQSNSCEFQSKAQVGSKSGVKMSKKSQKIAKNRKNLQKFTKIRRNEHFLEGCSGRDLRI